MYIYVQNSDEENSEQLKNKREENAEQQKPGKFQQTYITHPLLILNNIILNHFYGSFQLP